MRCEERIPQDHSVYTPPHSSDLTCLPPQCQDTRAEFLRIPFPQGGKAARQSDVTHCCHTCYDIVYVGGSTRKWAPHTAPPMMAGRCSPWITYLLSRRLHTDCKYKRDAQDSILGMKRPEPLLPVRPPTQSPAGILRGEHVADVVAYGRYRCLPRQSGGDATVFCDGGDFARSIRRVLLAHFGRRNVSSATVLLSSSPTPQSTPFPYPHPTRDAWTWFGRTWRCCAPGSGRLGLL